MEDIERWAVGDTVEVMIGEGEAPILLVGVVTAVDEHGRILAVRCSRQGRDN